ERVPRQPPHRLHDGRVPARDRHVHPARGGGPSRQGRPRPDVLGPPAAQQGERRSRDAGRAGPDVLRLPATRREDRRGAPVAAHLRPRAISQGAQDRADRPAGGHQGAPLADRLLRRGRRGRPRGPPPAALAPAQPLQQLVLLGRHAGGRDGRVHVQLHDARPGRVLRAEVLADRREDPPGPVRRLHQPLLPQPGDDLRPAGQVGPAARRPLRRRPGFVRPGPARRRRQPAAVRRPIGRREGAADAARCGGRGEGPAPGREADAGRRRARPGEARRAGEPARDHAERRVPRLPVAGPGPRAAPANGRVRDGQLRRGRAGRADGGDGGRRAGRGHAGGRHPGVGRAGRERAARPAGRRDVAGGRDRPACVRPGPPGRHGGQRPDEGGGGVQHPPRSRPARGDPHRRAARRSAAAAAAAAGREADERGGARARARRFGRM
ncbi:MAG: Glycosyl transferase, group 1 family protein, partial [uncultured Phycisphaerae bacterium]